jgi:Domain of unknown function (DUF5666)
MKQLFILLLLAGLVGCGDRPPSTVELQAEVDVVQPGATCRVAKNGGPLTAERGIGGTGASFNGHLVDRGIGGTGIVGVVTGFASVCVDGLEVRYDRGVPVDIDGLPGTVDQLRVGQVVAIRASDPAPGAGLPSWGRVISVRTELAGPIEAVEIGSTTLTIAGQRVSVPSTAWGANRFGLGDWAAVSGLRQGDGTVVASRLDDAEPGKLFVRGRVSRHDGALWIGRLRLSGPSAASLRDGEFVVVSGGYQSGVAQLTSASADMLAASPTTYFGGTVNQLILQAFVVIDGGSVWLNDVLKVPASPSVQQPQPMSGDAIVTLDRQPDGSFLATGLRYTKYPMASPDVAMLTQAWHVRSAPPLPVPPLPPLTIVPPSDAGDAQSIPPTPEVAHANGADPAPGLSADPYETALPPGADGPVEPARTVTPGVSLPPLISCAACAGQERSAAARLVAARHKRTMMATAKGSPASKSLPATVAVFTATSQSVQAGAVHAGTESVSRRNR